MRLKKGVKKIIIISTIVILFLGLGIYSYVKISQKIAYEKTYEYKLTTIGYSLDDAKEMATKYQDKELEYILKQDQNTVFNNIIKEEYFIYDKFYNYLDYYNQNKDENLTSIVEKVNAGVDKEYYTETVETDLSKGNLILVNKYYYLPDNYVPENLVSISLDYAYGEYGSQKMTEEAYDAFLNLWNASHNAGYYLMVNSSYRTHTEQKETYDEYANSSGSKYADTIAARPGHSEHQTGLTIDVFEKGTGQKDFADSDSYKWLKENAHKYGFIERYPSDKVDITGYAYESWHYRYVGIEAATYIYEHHITFDEYYAYFVK